MRKRYNRIIWKVRHLEIFFDAQQERVAASSRNRLTKNSFIDSVVDFLIQDGYSPLLPVEIMRKKLHSPHSYSESYIFLKVEDDGSRIKLVLDLRWSDHFLKNYGNYTGAERKEHYLDTQVVPDVSNQTGLDTTNTKSKFIDVVEQSSSWFVLVYVDDELYDSYESALFVIQQKVIAFDEEV